MIIPVRCFSCGKARPTTTPLLATLLTWWSGHRGSLGALLKASGRRRCWRVCHAVPVVIIVYWRCVLAMLWISLDASDTAVAECWWPMSTSSKSFFGMQIQWWSITWWLMVHLQLQPRRAKPQHPVIATRLTIHYTDTYIWPCKLHKRDPSFGLLAFWRGRWAKGEEPAYLMPCFQGFPFPAVSLQSCILYLVYRHPLDTVFMVSAFVGSHLKTSFCKIPRS